jgi:hypothetical protein
MSKARELIQKMKDKKPSVINHKNKRQVLKILYDLALPITNIQGYFHDENWQPINKVWKVFRDKGIDFEIINTKYIGNYPNTGKQWNFAVNWVDDKEKDRTVYGYMKASGTGRGEDPLEQYDVNFVVS